jgi:hypothetical protein
MESRISAKSSVDFAGPYDPNPIGIGKHKR